MGEVPDRNGGIPDSDVIPEVGLVLDMMLMGYQIGIVGFQPGAGIPDVGVVSNTE